MSFPPVNAKNIAKKYQVEFCATDASEIIYDNDVNLVFVTSRHDSHARYAALRARQKRVCRKATGAEGGGVFPSTGNRH